MLRYIPEEKIISNARKNLIKDFVNARKEILASDLNNEEKQEKISLLFKNTHKSISDLDYQFEYIDEIPEEDKKRVGIGLKNDETEIDEMVIKALVTEYSKRAKQKTYGGVSIVKEGVPEENIDTTQFETKLREYFIKHYNDLFDANINGSHIFLRDNPGIRRIAESCNIDPEKFINFGHSFYIQKGLVAEEKMSGSAIKVCYATPEGINDRLSNLHNEIIYKESGKMMLVSELASLQYHYQKYAEKNGIEISNNDFSEEKKEVDYKKVQAMAKYINEVINNQPEVEPRDNIKAYAEEITKYYSTIMRMGNLHPYELETVKSIVGEENDLNGLSLHINEDHIFATKAFDPLFDSDIVYGTPEYIKKEYERVVAEVEKLKDYINENEIDIGDETEEKQDKGKLKRLDGKLSMLKKKEEEARKLYDKYREMSQDKSK